MDDRCGPHASRIFAKFKPKRGPRMMELSAVTAASLTQPAVSGQIVLGIVTGILTTALLWGLRSLWEHKIRPKAEGILYNGLLVDGGWHSQLILPESATLFTLELRQAAAKITGEGRIRLCSSTHQFDSAVNVTGVLWEGYIAFTFRPKSRRSTAIMSGLFRVTDAGGVLHGYLAIRDKTSGDVNSFQAAFFQGSPSAATNTAFEAAVQKITSADA